MSVVRKERLIDMKGGRIVALILVVLSAVAVHESAGGEFAALKCMWTRLLLAMT